jgi:membrane associated rhomboid family serine protease
VSDRFRFSRSGRGETDPWFRIGTLDVGTVMLVVLLSVVSLVVFAVEPLDKPVMRALWTDIDPVLHGQVWRVVTWPFSNPGVSIWTAANIFFFYYFGIELESHIGKTRFAWLFVGIAVVEALVVVLLGLAFAVGSYPLATLAIPQFAVLLIYIAEWPHRRFFFGIPAWLIGLVLVGIQLIQYLGYRDFFGLVTFVVGLALCAVVARSVGLLTDYAWLPGVRVPHRRRKPRSRGRGKGSSGPTVVAGPWSGSATPEPPVSRDQQQLDALLDKISEHGMDSLSDRERQELLELRERLRKR